MPPPCGAATPSSQRRTATSLRRDAAGDFVVTDGPFAETKEALGGYYLIEAADLDEALALAKQIPAPVRRGRGPADQGLRLGPLRRWRGNRT